MGCLFAVNAEGGGGKTVSNEMELAIVYILSKVSAGIIIFLLWKLIFAIIDKKVSKGTISVFLLIYTIGVIVGIILFPDFFGIEMDNYSVYLYAIRFLPTYWHSIFTGALYGGCLMVIPHPLSIFLFQWLAFNSVIAYIFERICRFYKDKKCAFTVLIFFFLPETYNLVFSAYRNNGFTILCLFYYSYLFFAMQEKGLHNTLKEMLAVAYLISFIMVWRSEGILIGVGGLLFTLIFIWEFRNKKSIVVMITLICSLMCLNKIQGVGVQKYYGNDYMILNTMAPLYNILNNPYANLNYEGAEEDLTALDAVIPVEVIKQYGSTLTGYRNYNYTCGRPDFNQSMATDEASDRYMKSYYRIIMHNIGDYLDVQINAFYASLGMADKHKTFSYSGDAYIELNDFVYDSWLQGGAELNNTFLTTWWQKSPARQTLSVVILKMINIWRELWINSGLNMLLHVGTIIASVLLICLEFIFAIFGKGKQNLCWIILFGTVFIEMSAVVLFMPEGRNTYMYPTYYADCILLILYAIEHHYAKTGGYEKNS